MTSGSSQHPQFSHAGLPAPGFLWSLVFVGILSVSCASIFIRMADAPSLSIAAARVAIAALVMAPHALGKAWRKGSTPPGHAWKLCALSGVFLALHFMFWIKSIGLTSIASSVTLVSTTPIFSAVFSRALGGTRVTRTLQVGLLLTLAGSIMVAGTDFSVSTDALLGDGLAILGAVMAAGYFQAGSKVRKSLDLSLYTFAVYGTASLVLLFSCAVTGAPLLGFSSTTWAALILLALIPQLVGHTTFNWSLKFLPPTTVSVLVLGEPIGATCLAWLIFQEPVSPGKGAGLLVLALGIVLCSRGSVPSRDAPEPHSTNRKPEKG